MVGFQHSQVPAESGKCAFPGEHCSFSAIGQEACGSGTNNDGVLHAGRIFFPVYPGEALHQGCMGKK